jgi:putative ABC transport system substrate-binding protein
MAITIGRRHLITLLGGAAATWPIAAHAQQSALPIIGYLDSETVTPNSYRVAAFRQGLNEAGFIEGRNVLVEFRWGEGQPERLPGLAADLIRRGVVVIVANNASMSAAKAVTKTVPIVFVSGGDPIDAGLVTSLSRPGGNVTGVSFTTDPLNPKRLELLHELVPESAPIGALWGPQTSDASVERTEAAARALGRRMLSVRAKNDDELDTAFATMVQAGARALFVGNGAFFNGRRRQIVTLATVHALPSSYQQREFVLAGGLMSYGASDTDAYRRSGIYVGRILKGEKPGDIPVEMPAKYELVINTATAKALKLDIPPKLLALADEVID